MYPRNLSRLCLSLYDILFHACFEVPFRHILCFHKQKWKALPLASAPKSSPWQTAVAESYMQLMDRVVGGDHGFTRFEEASALNPTGSAGITTGRAVFGPELVPVQEQAAQSWLGLEVSRRSV